MVAGGSEGLGAEYARQLAERGLNLLLLAEKPDPLEQTAAEVRTLGVEVVTAVIDLAESDVVKRIHELVGDRDVGLLVYNAAFSQVCSYLDQSLSNQLSMLNVNCRGPVLALSALLPQLVERGRGGVILMSSLSALQGTPYVSLYAATKAFNLVLGEALWGELRREGIDVLSWMPGATSTPGWNKVSAKDPGVVSVPVMEPAPVVREALQALGKQPSGVAGRVNRALSKLLGGLGRRRAIEVMGSSMRRQFDL